MSVSLPPELWRPILQYATSSPSIDEFTSTTLSSLSESSESRLQAARSEALKTKSSLSLVSRTFHALAAEFLFEWVVLTRVDQLASVGSLLSGCHRTARTTTGRKRVKLGWWCRRLELHLPFAGLSSEGTSTPNALLLSCPRLIVFICASPRSASPSASLSLLMSGQMPSQPAFHLPPGFLEHVATGCPDLRRIEITGRVKMRLHTLESFLSRMPRLEIARFDGVTKVGEASVPAHDALLLPRLHTLHVADMPPTLSVYSLPSLHTLSFGLPTRNHVVSARQLSGAVMRYAQTLRELLITDAFSPLVPLALSLPSPLPHLSHLTFELHYAPARLLPSLCPVDAFPALAHITIKRSNGSWAGPFQVGQMLENVLELKEWGRMRALKEVRVLDSAGAEASGGLAFSGREFVRRFEARGVVLVVHEESA